MDSVDEHAIESDRRMQQLQALVVALRQHDRAARRPHAGASAAAAAATPEELQRASACVSRLSKAIDRSLGKQWGAAAAHGAHLAREHRAAEKLRDCVGGLWSARALAEGLGAPKPYNRHRQTVVL